MSELNETTPKRTRKPKVEGEVPVKRGKKTVKETAEPIQQEEVKEVKEVPVEQRVAVVSCLNPKLMNEFLKLAKGEKVEVVILEDRVIHDYIAAKNNKVEDSAIGGFLNDTSNRLHAEEQCVKLWAILTGSMPIEASEDITFTRTEVVKRTNLSHSRANDVFQLLRAFGMLEFVNGTHEFKLHFNKNRRHRTIHTEIMAMCDAVRKDILRYKASLESDSELSNNKKLEMYDTLRTEISERLEF